MHSAATTGRRAFAPRRRRDPRRTVLQFLVLLLGITVACGQNRQEAHEAAAADTDEAAGDGSVTVLYRSHPSGFAAESDTIDFGAVAPGSTALKTVSLSNRGPHGLRLTSLTLSPAGSPAFSITALPELDVPVDLDAQVTFELRFQPPNSADASTQLLVSDSDGNTNTFEVTGSVAAPRMTVAPKVLVFGKVGPGAPVTRTFKIANDGHAELKVAPFEIVKATGKVTLTLDQSGPLQLAAGDTRFVDVTLTAVAGLPQQSSSVASIVLHGNDLDVPDHTVSCLASAATATGLQVTPAEEVDFGVVALDVPSDREVTVSNWGAGPLTVTKVALAGAASGQFELVAAPMKGAPDFTAIDSPPKPVVVEAGGANRFAVRVKAAGPLGGPLEAELRIHSDDPGRPVWTLHLLALPAKSGKCEVSWVPQTLDYGVVSYGQAKTLPLMVKNTGSGSCGLADKVRIIPCSAAGCSKVGSVPFQETSVAPQLYDLAPGQTAQVLVRFEAPKELIGPMGLPIGVGDLSAPVWFHGLIGLKFRSLTDPADTGHWVPVDPTGGDVSAQLPNLKAGTGKQQVVVLPEAVDFGLVPLGCSSKVQVVSLYSNGSAPISVVGAHLEGCGSKVVKDAWPTIPPAGLPVSAGAPLPFGLRYVPDSWGNHFCTLVIATTLDGSCLDANGKSSGISCNKVADCTPLGLACRGQTFAVPLSAAAKVGTTGTEFFEQGEAPPVDLLLVVDNGGSAGSAQEKLAAGLQSLFAASAFTQDAWHVGVITTDMQDPAHKGQLRAYAPGVRIISSKTTKDPAAAIAWLVKAGTGGAAQGQGLAAAEAALTLPLIYDTAKSCMGDTGCPKGTQCVKGGDGTSACGGHNRGLLRKEATLAMLFLATGADHSPAPVSYYVNFFKSIKGTGNKDALQAHAIIGLPGDKNCQVPPGKRYDALVEATSGVSASVCAPDYAKALESMAAQSLGQPLRFPLKMAADKASIAVAIGPLPCTGALASCGTVCPPGAKSWSYDEAHNTVVLVSALQGGTCVPKSGQTVSIAYAAVCLP